jgi:hypothetical protein
VTPREHPLKVKVLTLRQSPHENTLFFPMPTSRPTFAAAGFCEPRHARFLRGQLARGQLVGESASVRGHGEAAGTTTPGKIEWTFAGVPVTNGAFATCGQSRAGMRILLLIMLAATAVLLLATGRAAPEKEEEQPLVTQSAEPVMPSGPLMPLIIEEPGPPPVAVPEPVWASVLAALGLSLLRRGKSY